LEEPGLDRKMIVKCIFTEVGWGMDWIDLARGRDMWQDFVNAVMNFVVPSNGGEIS